MISEYTKFKIPDQANRNDLIAEVNWESDQKTAECKVIKLTLPSGDKLFVKREDLNEILFAIGSPSDQKSLIPQKVETVHWRKTILGIKARKDIHKGEMVNFPIEISFPCTIAQEFIGGAAMKKDAKEEVKKDKLALPENQKKIDTSKV